MTTDDKLNKLVLEIDNVLSKMLLEYDLDPLHLSSIILARLVRMNQEFESHDDFNKIMNSAILKRPTDNERTLQ
jgi:predicted lipase